ncbi:MAG: hypothetical protein SPC84_01635, partial [Oscillospiraceae bacterium]|nr:hypothetical protein [Oscillospiraceae bacterium]
MGFMDYEKSLSFVAFAFYSCLCRVATKNDFLFIISCFKILKKIISLKCTGGISPSSQNATAALDFL